MKKVGFSSCQKTKGSGLWHLGAARAQPCGDMLRLKDLPFCTSFQVKYLASMEIISSQKLSFLKEKIQRSH